MALSLPTLDDFMHGQHTSAEAKAMLGQLWDTAATRPYFLGINGYRLGREYEFSFRMRPVFLSSGEVERVEIRVDEGAARLDLEMILFGEIHSTPEENKVGGADPTAFTIAKDCFVYDGLFHDIYDICRPYNASPVMSAAYDHQVEQIQWMVCMLARTIGKPKPTFVRPRSGRPDFKIAAPPSMKINEHTDKFGVEIGEPILVDDHPTRPRDEMYNLQQIRQCNWHGHCVLNKHATAVFKGRLKIWATLGSTLDWYFFADEIKVIAQDP